MFCFFFNDTATTEIYTLSLHDALPILDQAARAAWLYYIAGNTQDEIAHKLNVSRQAVQRLVSLAVSEKLIKFRLDHPIRSEEHTSELQSRQYLVCRLLLEKKKEPVSCS